MIAVQVRPPGSGQRGSRCFAGSAVRSRSPFGLTEGRRDEQDTALSSGDPCSGGRRAEGRGKREDQARRVTRGDKDRGLRVAVPSAGSYQTRVLGGDGKMRETRPGVWGTPGPVCGTHGGEAGTGGAGRVGAALCPCRPGPRGPRPACSEEPPATLRTAGLCRGLKASGSEDGDRQEPRAPRSRSLWTTREARRWPGLDSPSGHSGRGRRRGRGCGAASPRCSDPHPGGAAWARLTDLTPPV